jgi:hypothetical protein
MSRISDLARKADDITTKVVKIPEWGCEIGVRTMDGHGRNAYIENWTAAQESGDEEAAITSELELVIACAYDPEDGQPCFRPDDKEMLKDRSGAVIARIAAAAAQVNALDPDASERLGKDSSDSAPAESETPPESIPSDDSTSTSPENSI